MQYKILIVEDEAISLDIIVSKLKTDYDVISANNGKEGLELYKKFNPHIIITDIRMPLMDGIELIKKIRQIDQNSKIIITSFKNDIDTLLEATELKLFKYLVKPINTLELKNIITDCINELNNFTTIALSSIYLTDKLIWKKDDFELYFENKIVKLTPNEKKTLNLLLKKPDKNFTYDEIIFEVWEKQNDSGDRKTLKTLITGLRKKLKGVQIKNIYGFGYKIILSY